MDLKDFVSSSLLQILEGVKEAQAAENGKNISAAIGGFTPGGNAVNAGSLGIFTRVDFDVAVSAETTGGGGGNLKVFGVGVEGEGRHKRGEANRLVFSVMVRLPRGDESEPRK